ncbi:segregation/condensation protein A, partial [Candidatus Bipolaricaulota bacterium]|nr:segregation/condensation protein A [Candidatus Bipolaricaulota bacterium]
MHTSTSEQQSVTRLARYHINIKSYTGPFDVLLQLIASKKISIEEIDLSLLTEEYLNFLSRNLEEGIKLAPEFIQVASILIIIKTNSLLNEPPQDGELEELPYSKEELLKSLQELSEAKKLQTLIEPVIKENALKLPAKAAIRNIPARDRNLCLDPYEICRLYRELLERQPLSIKEKFIGDHIFDIQAAENYVLSLINSKERFYFKEIYATRNRRLIIGCFFAILK